MVGSVTIGSIQARGISFMAEFSQRSRNHRRVVRGFRPSFDGANGGIIALEPRTLLSATPAAARAPHAHPAARAPHRAHATHPPKRLTPAQEINRQYAAF